MGNVRELIQPKLFSNQILSICYLLSNFSFFQRVIGSSRTVLFLHPIRICFFIRFIFFSILQSLLHSKVSCQFNFFLWWDQKIRNHILWINTYPFNTELSHVHHPFRPIIFFSNIGSLVIKVRLEVSKLFEIDKILTYE